MRFRLGAGIFALAALLSAQAPSKTESEAKKAFDAGRFAEAGEKYSRAAQEAGVSPDRQAELRLEGAWSYYIGGKSSNAREELKAAFQAKPSLTVAGDLYSPDFARLARSVRAETGGSAAEGDVDVAEIKRDARLKLDQGHLEEAVASAKRAGSAKDPEVHRLLGEAYDRLGRAPEADAERRKASEIERDLITSTAIGGSASSGPTAGGPAAGAAWLQSASNLLRAGDTRGSEAAVRRAIEADPRNAEAHALLGDLLLFGEKDADAEREFTATVGTDPANGLAQYGLGVLAERQQKWNTAASQYRRALDSNPSNVDAALGLGRSLEQLKDQTGARLAYGRAIEMDPSAPDAHNDFGVFLARSGETDRAIEELIQAVRLAPQRTVFHENLGRVFRKKSMWKEAEREIAEASRLTPNDTVIWTTLGDLRRKLNRPQDAATAYAAAFQIDASSEEAASGLATALVEAGKPVDAEAAVQKALEARPESAVLWNQLGVLRTRRGAYAEAIAAFQKALGLSPSLAPAKTNLERAQQLSALERAAV